jgi:hypothetical protein
VAAARWRHLAACRMYRCRPACCMHMWCAVKQLCVDMALVPQQQCCCRLCSLPALCVWWVGQPDGPHLDVMHALLLYACSWQAAQRGIGNGTLKAK